MVSHYLANYIAILNYTIITNRYYCRIIHTQLGEKLTSLLLNNGYIAGYRIVNSYLYIQLKYNNLFNPLKSIKLISKPTNRIFWKRHILLKHCTQEHNVTQYVLSTSKGLLFSKDALAYEVGGELLFQIN